MSERDRFNKFVERNPHPHLTFFNRPHFTRRRFFDIVGSGVVGSYLVRQRRQGRCRESRERYDAEQGEELHLHFDGGRAQPYRHVRSESRQRGDAGELQSNHGQRN